MDNTTQYIAKWHKTFGIDYFFFNINPIEPEKKTQYFAMPQRLEKKLSSIEDIKTALLNIDCNLKRTAKNTVFSDGDFNSDIMIIGEAPGQEEDEQGKPFVGQSGKLLNNMLRAIGIKRSEVYISNIVFWRPPGNRTPSADEIALCMPYVEKHIELANPKVLLLLGSVAVKSILNTNESISRLRGRKNVYNGIDTIATFHPAYLLRSPGQKATAFKDFISLKIILNSKNN
ncbi:MAG: uracil-DNA glycosylase [Holosporales bacterium]|jgi:DNA polymerase|nr:uracil-DNA glycosylase [Holosporales bacterium]